MLHNYAYPTKLRVGCIGAGRHAYRDILPCFRYLPIDLVAVADHDREQGIATASLFGAKRFYPNHKALIAKETTLDALVIVVGPDAEGHPSYPELAADALRAGFHVWIESPPCTNKDDVKTLTNACMRGRKFLQANFNGMFMPAYLKAAAVMENSERFGEASSFAMRYPATLTQEALTEPCHDPSSLLALVRPYATLMRLFGEARGFMYTINPDSGDAVFTFAYASGLVGSLHLCGSQARQGPRERLEIIGTGAHLVVENASKVTYYRSSDPETDPDLLDTTDYYGAERAAPLVWEPQLSDPAPYNQHVVMQGYWGSLEHFAMHLLEDQPPRRGNVVDLLHMMLVLEKIQQEPERTWLNLY